MPKIEDWTEEASRRVEVAVSGLPLTRGQGDFEIAPFMVTLDFERSGANEKDVIARAKIRGRRDNGASGIRVWYMNRVDYDPGTVPNWLSEIITIFTAYGDDLESQLRAGSIAARWLTGFDPKADRYDASMPKDDGS